MALPSMALPSMQLFHTFAFKYILKMILTQPLRFLTLIPEASASTILRPQMCAMPTLKQLSQVLSYARNLGSSLHIGNMLTFQQDFTEPAKSTPFKKKF